MKQTKQKKETKKKNIIKYDILIILRHKYLKYSNIF